MPKRWNFAKSGHTGQIANELNFYEVMIGNQMAYLSNLFVIDVEKELINKKRDRTWPIIKDLKYFVRYTGNIGTNAAKSQCQCDKIW